MLELPEVEVLRKDLEKEVVGKRVKDVMIATPSIVRPFHRTRPDFIKALEGHKIIAARRRGRTIFLDLDEEVTWVIDARGPASLHRETATEDPGPDTHMAVTFTIGGAIHLSDSSNKPDVSVGVVPTADALQVVGLSGGSFDPLDDSITWMEFGELLASANKPLKLAFMDTDVIAGIGPVYSDEILYEAGLRWDRPSASLTSQEIRRLFRGMHEVIAAAMKFRGSSLDDNDPDEITDDDGDAAEHLKVYGREGKPSFRSRKPIEKAEIGDGMVTYFDPQSQY